MDIIVPQPEPQPMTLGDLGLTEGELHLALLAGEAEFRTQTVLDPPTSGGFNRWGRTVRALREALLPRGWDYDNPKGLPRTIDPTGSFAIIVSTGDSATGVVGMTPTTKRARGPAVTEAIARNTNQLSLFPDLDELAVADQQLTWMFLVHASPSEIRSELSLPAAIDENGFVDSWVHRILLAPVVLDTDEEGDDPPQDAIDVDVQPL